MCENNNHFDDKEYGMYKKALKELSTDPIPEFDPFLKLRNSKRKSLKFQKLFGYAAILIVGLGILLVFKDLNFSEKGKDQLVNKTDILEIQKNAYYALSTFSNEFNTSINKLDEFKQPFVEFNKLQDFEIKFYNPMINYKIK